MAKSQISPVEFDIQGHRGCRGLLPENSIPAFKKAVDLGVTTLELDVVVSKDNQVIISHDPYFSTSICTQSDGRELEGSKADHNIYILDYEEIRKFDCGSKGNTQFPEQQQMPVCKPALVDMIDSIESYSDYPVRYNIEIKRKPEWDSIFHPPVGEFVDLVMKIIGEKNISSRSTVQSFDLETLRILHQDYPQQTLALLIEEQKPLAEWLDRLGFTPSIFSPDFHLLTEEMLAEAREKEMLIIPWTVNQKMEMKKLIQMGVDGMITDYPDRLISLIKQ